MLVLTRHKNEKLMIGDDIIVTVCEISGGKVRIGVEAPLSKSRSIGLKCMTRSTANRPSEVCIRRRLKDD